MCYWEKLSINIPKLLLPDEPWWGWISHQYVTVVPSEATFWAGEINCLFNHWVLWFLMSFKFFGKGSVEYPILQLMECLDVKSEDEVTSLDSLVMFRDFNSSETVALASTPTSKSISSQDDKQSWNSSSLSDSPSFELFFVTAWLSWTVSWDEDADVDADNCEYDVDGLLSEQVLRSQWFGQEYLSPAATQVWETGDAEVSVLAGAAEEVQGRREEEEDKWTALAESKNKKKKEKICLRAEHYTGKLTVFQI